MRKQETTDIEPGMAEITIDWPGQVHPFTIRGSEADLSPYAKQLEAEIPAETRTSRVATTSKAIGHSMLQAVEQPIQGFVGRIKTDITAAWYDNRNNTRFLEALREKRQLEKDLRMAGRLGLLEEEVCAKHRKALQEVKNVR